MKIVSCSGAFLALFFLMDQGGSTARAQSFGFGISTPDFSFNISKNHYDSYDYGYEPYPPAVVVPAPVVVPQPVVVPPPVYVVPRRYRPVPYYYGPGPRGWYRGGPRSGRAGRYGPRCYR